MMYVGALISAQFIALTAYWLYKKYNPQAVLLTSGILMLLIALAMGVTSISLVAPTGSGLFDAFKLIGDTFSANMVQGGLMILAIGGYVAYMKEIKASDALVYVSMQPLSILRKYPYLALCSIIPIGQLLFISIPSATGLGMLLAVSVLPILTSLGVSKLSAVSVIIACTVFDIGPGSANTAKAAELAEMSNVVYFMEYQLRMVIPMTVFLMVVYYFSSRYFDRKDAAANKNSQPPVSPEIRTLKIQVPYIYALLPLLPLIFLLVFSKYVQLFDPPIESDTTTAILLSFFCAMVFEFIRKRSFAKVFKGVKTFWDGMGKTFGSVITLIVCAEIFSRGLIALGLIDAMIEGADRIGFSAALIGIVIAIMIFLVAVLMGSGNASFFSFGPLIPGIASRVGGNTIDMLLPMQLSAGMGRAVSPISGVIIAVSEIAGVSPFLVARRNIIPLSSALVLMLILNLFLN